MSWTLDEAKEMLTAWMNAEKAVATGQECLIGNRKLTRADAKVITEKLKFWRREVTRLEAGSAGGIKVRRAIPIDC